MKRVLIAVCLAEIAASACGGTLKVPLQDGWRFVKADDPKAGTNLTLQALSGILDRADRGDLSAGIDFDWAKPSFDDSSWKEVRVPHDWGVDKPFDSDRAYGDAFLDVTGVGWYRLKLRVEGGELRVGATTVAIPNRGMPQEIGYWNCEDMHIGSQPIAPTCYIALQLMVYYRYLPTGQKSAWKVTEEKEEKVTGAAKDDVDVSIDI